jgi:hypothetical protein
LSLSLRRVWVSILVLDKLSPTNQPLGTKTCKKAAM